MRCIISRGIAYMKVVRTFLRFSSLGPESSESPKNLENPQDPEDRVF